MTEAYAAPTASQAGHKNGAPESRLERLVTTYAQQKGEEERWLPASPVNDPPEVRNGGLPLGLNRLLRKENGTTKNGVGTMSNGNGSTSEIKCSLSLDEMRNIIAEEVARRLEPERLLGRYTKKATLVDGGRVEVVFSTSASAPGSQDATTDAAD